MMNDYNDRNFENFNSVNPAPQQSPKKERSPYLTKKMGAVLAALCILASGSVGFAGGVMLKSGGTSSPIQTAENSASSDSTQASTVHTRKTDIDSSIQLLRSTRSTHNNFCYD